MSVQTMIPQTITPERAALIQRLAREEIGNITLGRADYNSEPDFGRRHSTARKWDGVADDWTRRVDAAEFNQYESDEFQRVRAEFRAIMARASA